MNALILDSCSVFSHIKENTGKTRVEYAGILGKLKDDFDIKIVLMIISPESEGQQRMKAYFEKIGFLTETFDFPVYNKNDVTTYVGYLLGTCKQAKKITIISGDIAIYLPLLSLSKKKSK